MCYGRIQVTVRETVSLARNTKGSGANYRRNVERCLDRLHAEELSQTPSPGNAYGSKNALPHRQHRSLSAVGDTELTENVLYMFFDGFVTDAN